MVGFEDSLGVFCSPVFWELDVELIGLHQNAPMTYGLAIAWPVYSAYWSPAMRGFASGIQPRIFLPSSLTRIAKSQLLTLTYSKALSKRIGRGDSWARSWCVAALDK